MKNILLICMALLLNGCVTSFIPSKTSKYIHYTQTTEKNIASKSDNCDFKIQASPPDLNQYEEVGVLDGYSGTDTIGDYKDIVREKVCKAGGDLLVAKVSQSSGLYNSGIVFSKITHK